MGLRFISSVLYNLLRRYGQPINILYKSDISFDNALGQETSTLVKVYIPKALVLPGTQVAQEILKQILTRSLQNFKFGGMYSEESADFVVPFSKDIENISDDWWIVYNQQRYDIISTEKYKDQKAFYLKTKLIEGDDIQMVNDMKVRDNFNIEDASVQS